MTTSIESRLWLAVHLLYPNSAQGFDIYQAIMLQSDEALQPADAISLFSQLASVFDKITIIDSSLTFSEFEFDQIDRWKEIYKTSQKTQLIIFIGVLIFELKISEIAPAIKLTSEKALLLFHQTFKKFAQEDVRIKTKYDEQLNFKKQNDSKISYLFTYENLIEYCLGHLPSIEASKVEKGLELYPLLQEAKVEYLKIIDQIEKLKVARSNSSFLVKPSDKGKTKNRIKLVPNGAVASPVESAAEKKSNILYKNKKVMISTVSTFAVMAFILFQFQGIKENITGSEKTVVLHQIKKKPEDPASILSAIRHEIPQHKPQPQPPPRPSEPVQVVQVVAAPVVQPAAPAKPMGGLYRGVLYVKNLLDDNKKVLARLSELGAKKAGEVSLGWMKSEKMAYYHFTIPEQNVEVANKFFNEIGQLQIKFEAHPRLISAGSKRFIIEVKGQ